MLTGWLKYIVQQGNEFRIPDYLVNRDSVIGPLAYF